MRKFWTSAFTYISSLPPDIISNVFGQIPSYRARRNKKHVSVIAQGMGSRPIRKVVHILVAVYSPRAFIVKFDKLRWPEQLIGYKINCRLHNKWGTFIYGYVDSNRPELKTDDVATESGRKQVEGKSCTKKQWIVITRQSIQVTIPICWLFHTVVVVVVVTRVSASM